MQLLEQIELENINNKPHLKLLKISKLLNNIFASIQLL